MKTSNILILIGVAILIIVNLYFVSKIVAFVKEEIRIEERVELNTTNGDKLASPYPFIQEKGISKVFKEVKLEVFQFIRAEVILIEKWHLTISSSALKVFDFLRFHLLHIG